MPERKLSKENIAEIKKLYEEGKSVAEIARIYGLHHTSVIYWVKDVPKKLRIKTPIKERSNRYKKRIFKEYAEQKISKGGSQYQDILRKYLARQPDPDAPIGQLFAHKMLKK